MFITVPAIMICNNNITPVTGSVTSSIWIRWKVPLTALLLGIAAFVSYQSCITHKFLNYDDQRVLLKHPELYNQPDATSTFKAIIFDNYPREEPLLIRDLSWALDSRIFGYRNPSGAHFGNVLIHSVVMALLFVFILIATNNYKIALTATILSLVPAVHVEPVVWVMGRKDLLVSCFGLLAMISAMRMFDTRGRLSKSLYYTATLLFIILALLSKISAVVFPLALITLYALRSYLCGKRLPNASLPWKHILYSVIIFIPHLVISFIVYKWYYRILTEYGIMDRGYSASYLEHLRNLLVINPLVFWRYMQNLFVPADLSLFYNWPSVVSVFTGYHIAISAITIISGICLAIFLLFKRKDLFCYFLIVAILMIPYLNIVYFGIWVANRYIYFASLFLLMAIATVAVELMNSYSKKVAVVVVGLLTVFCVYNSLNKNSYIKVWQNDETLWIYESGMSDPRPEAFENLGSYYYTQGLNTTDMELRKLYFAKVKDTIEIARIKLGDSPKDKPLPILYRLLFLDALIGIVQNDSPQDQLESLMLVEEIRPDFNAVLWQLTVFYYKEAIKAKKSNQQKELVYKSLVWYRKYLEIVKHDSSARKKARAVREEYLRDFPFIKDKINKLNSE